MIFTILMQVQSVCPILAPVIGAYLLLHVQWQGIFWILAVCGGLGALAVWLMVPETGKQNETGNNDFGNAVKRLIGCRRYWLMTLSFASLMGALFSYIGSSSFIYVTLFQASATEFSLYFGLNSLGVIAFGLVSVRMLRVMPLKRALAVSFAVHSTACFLLVAALSIGLESKIASIVWLFFVVASLGLLFGGLTSETKYSVPRDLAGTASAVLGVLQYAAASLSGLVIGWLQAKTLMPIAAVLSSLTMVSVLLWFLGSRTAKSDDLTGHACEMEKEQEP